MLKRPRDVQFPWMSRSVWLALAPLLLVTLLTVSWAVGQLVSPAVVPGPDSPSDPIAAGCPQSASISLWPFGRRSLGADDLVGTDILVSVPMLSTSEVAILETVRNRGSRIRVVTAVVSEQALANRLASTGVEIRVSRDPLPRLLVIATDDWIVVGHPRAVASSDGPGGSLGWIVCRDDATSHQAAREWLLSRYFSGRRL